MPELQRPFKRAEDVLVGDQILLKDKPYEVLYRWKSYGGLQTFLTDDGIDREFPVDHPIHVFWSETWKETADGNTR